MTWNNFKIPCIFFKYHEGKRIVKRLYRPLIHYVTAFAYIRAHRERKRECHDKTLRLISK